MERNSLSSFNYYFTLRISIFLILLLLKQWMCNSSKLLFVQKSTIGIRHSVLERDILYPYCFIINGSTNCYEIIGTK